MEIQKKKGGVTKMKKDFDNPSFLDKFLSAVFIIIGLIVEEFWNLYDLIVKRTRKDKEDN